jgi:hypothetical protein
MVWPPALKPTSTICLRRLRLVAAGPTDASSESLLSSSLLVALLTALTSPLLLLLAALFVVLSELTGVLTARI